MRDNIPAPSPKAKLKRNKLPAAIADKDGRVLISSIASYEKIPDGKISCYLKSGETVTLDFDVEYLSLKAMAVLDAHFNIERPANSACSVCIRKDEVCPEEAPRKWCDYCYSDRGDFMSPEGDTFSSQGDQDD